MDVTLYVIPGSHPSLMARLMLERKGIPYRRVDLVPAVHKVLLRLLGFERRTVPAMKVDGRRVQGTRAISQALDDMKPEPRLFPQDAAARARVEEAEAWGDDVLQSIPRRLSWWAIRRDASAAASFLFGSRLPVPSWLVLPTVPLVSRLAVRHHGATDEAVRADLAALPGHLDRVDGWIREGVLGGESLNAADYQIGCTVRLLMCFEDLRQAIAARPAGKLALRVSPSYAGHFGAGTLPATLT